MFRSIESALAMEFVIDAATIWAALRPVSKIRLGRLLFASAISSVFSVAVLLVSPAPFIRALLALIAAPVIIRIGAGRIGLYSDMGAAACMLSISSFISAAIHITDAHTLPGAAAAAITAAFGSACLLGRLRRWLDSWEIRVDIFHSEHHAAFTALIDTGNRLAEPISALPVMVVEAEMLKNILPEDFDPYDAREKPLQGFRLAAYGGVGGSGALVCFMPESLFIDDIPVSGIWIGVYPDRLPGRYRALAPPAIIRNININRNGGRNYARLKIHY